MLGILSPLSALGTLRPAPTASVLIAVAVAAWVVGCVEPRAPVAVGSVPELMVEIGSTESVDLAGYFSDPDGDELSYVALSSDADVAAVAISRDAVAVTGVTSGSAEITVTASDGSSSALQGFTALVPLADRKVLQVLYDELDGDNWWNNTNWLTDASLDEWHGVSTDSDGRVRTLDVRVNRLRGEIPPELGSLSSLRSLHLNNNSLRGEIPSELGDLSNLEILSLGGNSLTGAIPPELGDLSNLEYLSLSLDSLTGAIPPELGDLSNLEILYLGGNRLTGKIPPELGGLSSLRSLYLDGNSLRGEIPPELGDLSNLEILSLAGNSLIGEIPLELRGLSSLGVLFLEGNSLTGEIPRDFLDLSLWHFDWYDNDGLCAPNTIEFDRWIERFLSRGGPRCD